MHTNTRPPHARSQDLSIFLIIFILLYFKLSHSFCYRCVMCVTAALFIQLAIRTNERDREHFSFLFSFCGVLTGKHTDLRQKIQAGIE